VQYQRLTCTDEAACRDLNRSKDLGFKPADECYRSIAAVLRQLSLMKPPKKKTWQNQKNIHLFYVNAACIDLGATDTLKIQPDYKHRLDSTGILRTMVVNQKLYSPDGVLFREVNYD